MSRKSRNLPFPFTLVTTGLLFVAVVHGQGPNSIPNGANFPNPGVRRAPTAQRDPSISRSRSSRPVSRRALRISITARPAHCWMSCGAMRFVSASALRRGRIGPGRVSKRPLKSRKSHRGPNRSPTEITWFHTDGFPTSRTATSPEIWWRNNSGIECVKPRRIENEV
jgi:hypothetical protein